MWKFSLYISSSTPCYEAIQSTTTICGTSPDTRVSVKVDVCMWSLLFSTGGGELKDEVAAHTGD